MLQLWVQARTEFSRAMAEKDEDYRRRELALEERHSRELAKKSQTSAEEMMVAVSGSGEESEGSGAGQGGDRKAVAPGAMERKSSKVSNNRPIHHPINRFVYQRLPCWGTSAARYRTYPYGSLHCELAACRCSKADASRRQQTDVGPNVPIRQPSSRND